MADAPQRETPAGGEVKGLSLGKRLLVFPIACIFRLWLRSLRMRLSEEYRSELEDVEHPTVVIVWHNRLSVAAEYVRRFRRGRRLCGLVSGSRDGAWLETFFRAIGILVTRGSRKRRGSQAIRELIGQLKEGHDVGITPDGSRGPCYEAKPGALLVAKVSKAPVLLLSFEFSSAWRLNSWDGFYLPKPFSRVTVLGKRLEGGFFDDMETEDAVATVNSGLMSMTKDTVKAPPRAVREKND